MEFRLLPILACFSLLVTISHAALPPQLYWKSVLPQTSIPKAIKDLLRPVGLAPIDASRPACIVHNDFEEASQPEELKAADGSNFGNFFLEKDLHSGTKMKLHLTKTANGASFLPRQVSDSIPFSSSKLPEILKKFSLKEKSAEAAVIKREIENCEKPAMDGGARYCVTSLESLIDFSTSKLGRKVNVLMNEVETGSEEYEFGEGIKMVAEKSVVCHKLNYPYAVFYCHMFKKTRTYMIPLVGSDGRKAKAIAACHTDTSAWNPKHAAFQVLKVKPGTVPVCHFLHNNAMVWIPK